MELKVCLNQDFQHHKAGGWTICGMWVRVRPVTCFKRHNYKGISNCLSQHERSICFIITRVHCHLH